jgi:copper(I)-binding protein
VHIRIFLAAVLAALTLAAGVAAAAPVKVGDLILEGFWTNATPPGAPTATGYLTITNTGTAADSLVAVSPSIRPAST